MKLALYEKSQKNKDAYLNCSLAAESSMPGAAAVTDSCTELFKADDSCTELFKADDSWEVLLTASSSSLNS